MIMLMKNFLFNDKIFERRKNEILFQYIKII